MGPPPVLPSSRSRPPAEASQSELEAAAEGTRHRSGRADHVPAWKHRRAGQRPAFPAGAASGGKPAAKGAKRLLAARRWASENRMEKGCQA
eukprot:scaffold105966_cov32-Prasinocladus_malaysianus.AAC.1